MTPSSEVVAPSRVDHRTLSSPEVMLVRLAGHPIELEHERRNSQPHRGSIARGDQPAARSTVQSEPGKINAW